jgi:hypothetical protein
MWRRLCSARGCNDWPQAVLLLRVWKAFLAVCDLRYARLSMYMQGFSVHPEQERHGQMYQGQGWGIN